jgi:hypothetical protein
MNRKATDIEREVFEYLNELKESGGTNMFGARPYIMAEFEMEASEAKRILMLWMKNFSKTGDYETINDESLTPQK